MPYFDFSNCPSLFHEIYQYVSFKQLLEHAYGCMCVASSLRRLHTSYMERADIFFQVKTIKDEKVFDYLIV